MVAKKYADFLNLNGRLIIGNDVIAVNECEEKIYFDAQSVQNDFSKLKSVTLRTNDRDNNNLKSDIIEDWSQQSTPRTYDKNFWGKFTKKTWAEIEGESHLLPYYDYENRCYAKNLSCTFELKAYAQSRNFWGNFVFGNWSTNVIYDAEWHYRYGYIVLTNTLNIFWHQDDFPTYHCLPNPAYTCPTSPYHDEWAGNGCISPITPDGAFSCVTNGFWIWPIDVYDYNITITIDNHAFNFQR